MKTKIDLLKVIWTHHHFERIGSNYFKNINEYVPSSLTLYRIYDTMGDCEYSAYADFVRYNPAISEISKVNKFTFNLHPDSRWCRYHYDAVAETWIAVHKDDLLHWMLASDRKERKTLRTRMAMTKWAIVDPLIRLALIKTFYSCEKIYDMIWEKLNLTAQ